jgi:hypothetical protein
MQLELLIILTSYVIQLSIRLLQLLLRLIILELRGNTAMKWKLSQVFVIFY